MRVHYAAVTPVLIVDKVAPTQKFFCDRLGFIVRAESEHDGAIGFATLQRDDVTLIVQSDAALRADAGESYVPGPYKASLYIEVDDVEALVPEVADADVVQPLARTSRGRHQIAIREPGGNIIVFASRLRK
jgi:hypothetical protein